MDELHEDAPPFSYSDMPVRVTDRETYPGPYPCDAAPCLFNIATDPTEHHDIATKQPDIVKQLMAEFMEAAKSEVLVADSGLCPTRYGTASDPRCGALAKKTGFWQPWL